MLWAASGRGTGIVPGRSTQSLARNMEASRETPKQRAERIRDQRHWTTFWFILIAQVLAFIATVNGVFGRVGLTYVFLGALIVATVAAGLLHEWRTRRLHPTCPGCGAELQIVESGPGANYRNLRPEHAHRAGKPYECVAC